MSENLAIKFRVTLLLLIGALGGHTHECLAQGADPLTIRVESREVFVPVYVTNKGHARMRREGYEEVPEWMGLSREDFHIFEDGKEQRIQGLAVEVGQRGVAADNFSRHIESSCTAKGIWSGPDIPSLEDGTPFHVYVLSYVPPQSPVGSCHHIRVKVDHRDAAIYSRDEYCRTQHSPNDPLKGTEESKRMEAYANSLEPGKIPLSVQASSFFGSTDASRVYVAVEFPWQRLKHSSDRCWLEAEVNLLGLITRADNSLLSRLSDNACYSSSKSVRLEQYYETGCELVRSQHVEMVELPTRYETQVDLPEGDYTLTLVLTDDAKFGRVQVPVHVRSYAKQDLAISDVMLCKRSRKIADQPIHFKLAPDYVRLVSNGVEFTPSGDTRFTARDPMIAYFEVYGPRLTNENSAAKVQFRLRITKIGTGEVQLDTGLRDASTFVKPGSQTIAIAQDIATGKAQPGEYRLEVQAFDSAGRKTDWRTRNFTIE